MDVRILSDDALRKLIFDTPPKHIKSGVLGAAKGEYTERRVLKLLRACTGVRSARRAPHKHDQLGVDIIVELCGGSIKWVQVKSSSHRRSTPAIKKAERNGAVIVCVPVEMSDSDAVHRIRIALGFALVDPHHTIACSWVNRKRKNRQAWRTKHRKRAQKKWREKKLAREINGAIMRWEDDGGR